MKKNKLLTALTVGALFGAIALGTTNSAFADSNIVLQAGGTGDPGDTWVSGVATNSGLDVTDVNGGDRGDGSYKYWTNTQSGTDTLTIKNGGTLTVDGLTNGNDALHAEGGNINLNSGALNIAGGSYIYDAVNTVVSGTLNITGGDVTLGSGTETTGDRVNGTINMSSGDLYLNGGTNLGTGSTISATDGGLHLSGNNTFNGNTSIISDTVLTVTGGKQTFVTADSINVQLYNKGTVAFNGGSIDYNINNYESTTGTIQIAGNVQNNATIDNNVDVISGTFTNSASNGRVNGTTHVNDGASAVNSGVIGAVTNDYIYTNQGNGQTGAVTNNKTLNITGGTVTSVNNNDANSTVAHSGGAVGSVINKGITAGDNTGSYTLSGNGSITGLVTNQGTFNLQNSGVSQYEQLVEAAVLNITGGGSLYLNVDGTDNILGKITDGTVNLGNNNSIGTLVVNNGITNKATVTTTGGSVLNLQSGNLTAGAGTSIGKAARVTIGAASGDATQELTLGTGTLTLDGGDGTSDAWNAKGKVTVNGEGVLNLEGVTQNGTLSQTGGTVNVKAAQTLGENTSITGGTLNIDENLTLTGGTITAGDNNALVSIDAGKTFTITGGTVTLDGGTGDAHNRVDWQGTVNLNGANAKLVLDHIYDVTRTESTETKNKSGRLVANLGELWINNATVLLGSNDLIEQAVDLHLFGDIVVSNTSNATVDSSDAWNAGDIYQKGGILTLQGLEDNVLSTASSKSVQSESGDLNILGTVELNSSDDFIEAATNVTLAEGNKLVIKQTSAKGVTLNGTGTGAAGTDTWAGSIDQQGGKLTLTGGNDSTTKTKLFTKTGGDLVIDGNGSLTLNTVKEVIGEETTNYYISEITGGNVQLGSVVEGDDPDTAGALILNNGRANAAVIKTSGTSEDNALTVQGKVDDTATTLTLSGVSDIEYGTVTVGDGTSENVLNMAGNSIIGKIADVVIYDKAKISMGSGANASLTINSDDVWNGEIYQDGETNSTLTILNDDYTKETGYLTSEGGNINIGYIGDPEDQEQDPDIAGTLKLNNAQDKILAATKVTINTNGTLQQSAGTVELDDATDDWEGAIDLSSNGELTLTGFENVTTNSTLTYNQTGGKATLNGTDLVLDTDDSVVDGGAMILTNNSGVAFVNGTDNAAAIKMGVGQNDGLYVGKDSTLTLQSYNHKGTELIQTAIDDGVVYVGGWTDNDNSVLNVASGTIAQVADVNIFEGAALNITGADAVKADPTATTPVAERVASVILDGTDFWEGDINLSNTGTASDDIVSLTLNGVTQTTGDKPTAEGGTSPYYSQSGGSLFMLNGTTLSMADSEKISGGNMTIDEASVYNSLSNGFSLTNLQTAGLINGINDGRENYAVASDFKVGNGGFEEEDTTANFNMDIYARHNKGDKYSYDTFGSDSDTISATNGENATLHINDWKLDGDIYGWDAPIDRHYSLDKIFKGTINADHEIDFTTTNKEVFTPIGWYGLHSAGQGSYTFDLNRYNPGVFRGQITKLAQYQNQLSIDDMLFNHTMLDQGFKGNDYIASNPNRLASATDLYPPYQYSRKDGGLWVKMYGTFEKLNMNHGLNVGNNAYGTIIGADFGLKELKHGWQFMPTAYIGYNGAHQYWKGYGAYQNGGQLGFMGTWYKNNFMIGALAYGGLYNNDMDTPRGSDDTLGYFAGGAIKSAYNWRFAKDWSLQPNLLVAYNFFGKENWHSDFGQMGMMSGMLHGVNIAPGVNLIWEKETFSIYGTLQYMYNINQSVGGRAGNVGLPTVHMDRGYIQYGLGFNKSFTDRFSGFFQAVLRNVGRTGVGLQMGFQWRFGKGSSNDSAKTGDVTPALKDTKVTLNYTK